MKKEHENKQKDGYEKLTVCSVCGLKSWFWSQSLRSRSWSCTLGLRCGSTVGQGACDLPDSLVAPQIKKLADRSDLISEVPKCSKSKFSRAPPRTPLGELTALPRTPSWWEGTRYPLPRTPPPLFALQASLLRVSRSNPLQSWQPY